MTTSGTYDFSVNRDQLITGALRLAGVIAQGETVDWDVSAGKVDDNAMTATTGDCSDFGVALEAAAAGTSAVEVLLLPGRGSTT